MSGFTMSSSGIDLVNVDDHIDVYVANSGGNLSLYHDSGATNSWGSDPDFDVPKDKVYAVYFRLTMSTAAAGDTFPAAPLDWGTTGQPSTVTCGKMLTNYTAFSIKVDNSSPPKHDARHDFDILVTAVTGVFRVKVSKIDPTIVEKGEEAEGGGPDRGNG